MGRAQKQKGSAYEGKLVRLLCEQGWEAWRVPLSGALGHNPNSALPDWLRQALSGDVAVRISPERIIPIEVKYRTDAASFKTLYNHMEQHGFVRQVYPDAVVYPEGDWGALTGEAAQGGLVLHPAPILNKTLNDWYVGSELLALKAHRQPWLLVQRVEPVPVQLEGAV